MKTKFLESTIQNALEQDARLDSTAPQDPNPTLPRDPVRLIHLIDPADPTKPLRLLHYKPINLTIRLDQLSVNSTNHDGSRDRFLACTITLPQDILDIEEEQVEIPLWPEEKALVKPPKAAPWALFKLIPSLVSSKSIHVKNIIVKIPVEQLQ